MNQKTGTVLEKVADRDLRDWLTQTREEVRELLVEAVLPQRRVIFKKQAGARHIPLGMESDAPTRASVLDELNQYLSSLLQRRSTLLRAAGAFAVEANGPEVQKLLQHPLVKAVRINRKLGPFPNIRA